uniref:Uncharacterized protein n=1 Tax=Bionectria ochroleuca TaxID=29856 RepID=A0A8H7NHN6_BIOOC
MLIDAAPDKFDNWKSNKWGTAALEISRPYGPVHAKRCIGIWNDTKLYIEVWPIRTGLDGKISYIVEASFKTASREVAMAERGKLAAYLEEKGWLLARDSLKTQLIMENY